MCNLSLHVCEKTILIIPIDVLDTIFRISLSYRNILRLSVIRYNLFTQFGVPIKLLDFQVKYSI